MKNNTNTTINSNYRRIINTFFFYFIWISLHYFASHLYIYLCVPVGFYGFFSSFFTTQMPQCIGLRYIINFGTEQINIMWFILGTFIMSLISLLKND
jgi:hypothetical protein